MPIETRRGIRLPHLKEPAASREVAASRPRAPFLFLSPTTSREGHPSVPRGRSYEKGSLSHSAAIQAVCRYMPA